MLSSRYINQTIPADLWDRYSQVETDFILAFARRARDMDYTALWYADRLKAMGMLREELERIVAKSWPGTQGELAAALDQAGFKSLSSSERIFQHAAKAGALMSAPPIAESLVLRSILEAGYHHTVRRLETVNRTAVNSTVAALENVFAQVNAGDITLQAGVEQAVNELATRGVTGSIGVNGRRYELAPYVRAEIQTNVAQATADLGFARMDEYGSDLLVVSAHAGARPRCFPFQGRVFSRSGRHPKYAPWSSTSYGEIAGLLGRNCGHFVDPFIEGLDREPTKEERDPAKYELGKSNAQVYAESQEQRGLERRVRAWKHRVSALEAEGIDARRARDKVREWQGQLREHVEETGRTRRYDRERVVAPAARPERPAFITIPRVDTMEEARDQAAGMGVRAMFGSGEDRLEMARVINQSLADVKARGLPLPSMVGYSSAGFANAPVGVVAVYLPGKNAIALPPGLSAESLARDALVYGGKGVWSSVAPNHAVVHELGHAVSAMMRPEKYAALSRGITLRGSLPLNSRIRDMVMKEVSEYAADSPLELVAEVFAGKMAGKDYSEKIMRIFAAYGGVWR